MFSRLTRSLLYKFDENAVFSAAYAITYILGATLCPGSVNYSPPGGGLNGEGEGDQNLSYRLNGQR